MGQMTPITIVLPEQAQAYIDERLASGAFATVDELITVLVLAEKMRQEEQRPDEPARQNLSAGELQKEGLSIDSNRLLEQRVALLEAQLLRVMTLLKTDRPVASDWMNRLAGSISNEDLFVEALEYGRSVRMQDQHVDDVA
jgi:Arc/MetJ-type ribon-helix-helix transcriptional regulator